MSIKEMSRRDFLKLAGAAFGTAVAGDLAVQFGPGVFQHVILGKAYHPYSEENLLHLLEQEPPNKLDPRIGVIHSDGKYPYISGQNFFQVGLDVATRAGGFQTVEVELDPKRYDKYHLQKPQGPTLDALANNPTYSKIFSHPDLKTIIITAEPSSSAFNSQDIFKSDEPSPVRLQQTYEEFYGFASEILEHHSQYGKTIIIQIPNELDWYMLGYPNQEQTKYYETQDAPDHAITNAITYLTTVLSAVSDANAHHADRPPLATSVEINKVQDVFKNKKRALNAVLSRLSVFPTYIGYSSYDTLEDAAMFDQAIDLIKALVPKSRVMISELGIGEMMEWRTTTQITTLVQERIKQALDKNCAYVELWELFDNECTARNPSSQQCHGFWMFRPDGTPSSIFEALDPYRIPNTTPAKTLGSRQSGVDL